MQTLSNIKGDKANGFQKILAVILLLGVVWGAVKILTPFLKDLNVFAWEMWKLLLIGTPLVLLVLYIVSNPLLIWGFFKTLSYKLTAWLVKMDPLSVMDRYVEYLRKKVKNLGETIVVLKGKQSKYEREALTLEQAVQTNLKSGAAAKKLGKSTEASAFGIKVQTDMGTLERMKPTRQRLQSNLEFLQKLQENWTAGIDQLSYQVAAKRREYEINSEIYKGLKNAEDFINSDNEAAQLYGMSLQALEETVTQQIGYIEEFERKSKGIMSEIDISKQANADEGLAMLEKYIQDGNIQMPDFGKIGGIQEVDYIEVNQQQASSSSKFNLSK